MAAAMQYIVSGNILFLFVFSSKATSGTRFKVCAFESRRGTQEGDHVIGLAAIGFSVLALAIQSSISRHGLVSRAALRLKGRRLHVDNRRRGSSSRPDRLLGSSAYHSVLLRNPSLSKQVGP